MASNSFILCVNSGSSSLKFAVYRMGTEPEALIAGGAVERIGLAGGRLWVRSADRKLLRDRAPTHRALLVHPTSASRQDIKFSRLLDQIDETKLDKLQIRVAAFKEYREYRKYKPTSAMLR